MREEFFPNLLESSSTLVTQVQNSRNTGLVLAFHFKSFCVQLEIWKKGKKTNKTNQNKTVGILYSVRGLLSYEVSRVTCHVRHTTGETIRFLRSGVLKQRQSFVSNLNLQQYSFVIVSIESGCGSLSATQRIPNWDIILSHSCNVWQFSVLGNSDVTEIIQIWRTCQASLHIWRGQSIPISGKF